MSIKFKRVTTSGLEPAPEQLVPGEFYINLADGKLFTIDSLGFPINLTGALELHTHEVSEVSGALPDYGNNYAIVKAKGTPTQNAAELTSKYNALKALNPTAEKEANLILSSGYYEGPFVFDTPHINIISLAGTSPRVTSTDLNTPAVSVTTPYVTVRSLNTFPYKFSVAALSVNILSLEDIIAGDNSFENCYGVIKNCVAGEGSFKNIHGILIHCDIASGEFDVPEEGGKVLASTESYLGNFVNVFTPINGELLFENSSLTLDNNTLAFT